MNIFITPLESIGVDPLILRTVTPSFPHSEARIMRAKTLDGGVIQEKFADLGQGRIVQLAGMINEDEAETLSKIRDLNADIFVSFGKHVMYASIKQYDSGNGEMAATLWPYEIFELPINPGPICTEILEFDGATTIRAGRLENHTCLIYDDQGFEYYARFFYFYLDASSTLEWVINFPDLGSIYRVRFEHATGYILPENAPFGAIVADQGTTIGLGGPLDVGAHTVWLAVNAPKTEANYNMAVLKS